MTTVEPGFNNKGVTAEGEITETPGGKFRYQIGDVVFEADSEEELQDILNYIALQHNKPVDELEEADLSLNFVYGEFWTERDPNDRDLMVYTLKDKGKDKVEKFLAENFYGSDIPTYPPEFEDYLESNLTTLPDQTGTRLEATLYGLAGSAQEIYNHNYGPPKNELPPIPDADLDPDTLKLLEKLFGPNTDFNQGHLNTLKMMGLVDGKGSEAANTWKLNTTGDLVLDKFETLQSHFIPSTALLGLPSSAITLADRFDTYFNADGTLKEGSLEKIRGEGDAKGDAEKILEAFPESGAVPLPKGTTLDEKSQEMLNELFGLPKGNKDFTVNQLNAAIAMGLVSYNPETKAVTITKNGEGFLTAALKTPETKSEEEKEKEIEVPKTLEDLVWAQDIIRDNWDEFDTAGKGGDTDEVISTEDLEAIMEKYPADHDLHKAAKIILEGRDSGLTEQLFRGNKEDFDKRFNRTDFDHFAKGNEAIVKALKTEGDTPEAIAMRKLPHDVLDALKETKRFYKDIDNYRGVDIEQIIDNMIESDDPELQKAGEILKAEYEKPDHGMLNGLFSADGRFNENDLDTIIALFEMLLPDLTTTPS